MVYIFRMPDWIPKLLGFIFVSFKAERQGLTLGRGWDGVGGGGLGEGQGEQDDDD